jgi:hypothetical protein
VVSFAFRLLYPRGKRPPCPLDMRRTLLRREPVAIPTELSRLVTNQKLRFEIVYHNLFASGGIYFQIDFACFRREVVRRREPCLGLIPRPPHWDKDRSAQALA